MDDGPLTQTKVTFTVQPTQHSTMPNTITNKLSEDLKTTAGKITYKGTGEGKLNICVRIDEIPGKKYIKPALIGFRVKESGDLDQDDPGALLLNQSPEEVKAQSAAKQHLSEMERILNKMIRDVNLLLKNADLIKNDEAGFHKQSEEMNAACRWWPMLHVVVLLVMGFTQANHVIKFFKGKHIIWEWNGTGMNDCMHAWVTSHNRSIDQSIETRRGIMYEHVNVGTPNHCY